MNISAPMDVGRGGQWWAKAPLDIENFSKKGYFLNFETTNFTAFGPAQKHFGKIP